MQILKLSPQKDRESWLEARKGVIGSSKSKAVAPLKRGNTTPAGVYELLAEQVAITKDGEPERDRGLRLEGDAIKATQKKFKLKLNPEPGMWLSDDGKRGVTPDSAEDSDKPKYAVEAKCLDSKNHLMAILNDHDARQQKDYNPINSLKVGREDYSYQVVQYFSINPDLQKMYFTFYDDRVALENVLHYVIVIERSHVEDLAKEQELSQRAVINQVNEMIKILKEIK